MRKPSYLGFNKTTYFWKSDINYREHPELYRVGKGEQGVLICEPYKSEILKYWKFRTPSLAEESSSIIFKMFKEYLRNKDFIGADMARKFLQMGFTRARRYANYKGGKKYNKKNNYSLNEKGTGEIEKAKSAALFYAKWKEAESDTSYAQQKQAWRNQYG